MILQNNQIVINSNGVSIYVKPLVGSEHYNELMGDEYLYVKFNKTGLVSIPVGSSIKYNNQDFVLLQTPNIKKVNETEYNYDCKFHGIKNRLDYFVFVEQANDKTNCRTSFTMTAKPIEFVRMIVTAIQNRLGIEVNLGNINSEDNEKTVTFDNLSIREALNTLANECECEWNIYFNENGCFIDFGEILYNSDSLVLDYGEGKGLKSGVSITPEDKPQIKRLWVQGTERNINYLTYLPQKLADFIGLTKSSKLIMPYNSDSDVLVDKMSTTIKYDIKNKLFGEFYYRRLSYVSKNIQGQEVYATQKYKYPADKGFNATSSHIREYSLDNQGRYIERVGNDAVYEQSYKNEDIYPRKVCAVNSCTITEGTGDNLGTFEITVKVNSFYYPNNTSIQCYSENHTYIGNAGLNKSISYELDKTDYFEGKYNNQNAIFVRVYFPETKYIGINQYVNGYYDSCYILYGVIDIPKGLTPYWSVDNTKIFPNYKEIVADGEKAVVVFQSGMLSGKEFEMQTDSQNKPMFTLTENEAKFVCLRKEVDNITMPETITGYNAKKGDYFAVFGVVLPTIYLADAEVELLKSAVKYMADNEDQQYQFSGELDSLWVQSHESDKSKLLIVGQQVDNSDFSQYGMKITRITTDLTDEYKKSLTFSSGRIKESLGSKLKRTL